MKLKQELQKLSRKELEKHRDHVDQALEKLDSRKLDEARAELEKRAKELGVTLNEVMGGAPAKSARKKSKSASKAKYRNPDDASQTWTGRGRKPKWVHDALQAGADISDLEI